jgi:hypothetical protein
MFKISRNGNLHAITANIPNKSISPSSLHLKGVEWPLQQERARLNAFASGTEP